jgi:hypothetical protein
MRTTTARLTGLAALLALLLGGAVVGQPPVAVTLKDPKKPAEEKKPTQLEEWIAQALRDNPDVRVAEAKAREAEAELNRARLQAIQKVVAHQHTVETLTGAVKSAEARLDVAQASLRLAEAQYQRVAELVKRGGAAKEEADAAQATLQKAKSDVEVAKAALQAAKADLAKAQAELPYLLGKSNKDGEKERVRLYLDRLIEAQAADDLAVLIGTRALARQVAEQPKGTVAEKLRKVAAESVKMNLFDAPLDDVLAILRDTAGVPIVDNVPREQKTKKITGDLRNIPLGAAFQLVEDAAGVQFGVREYGLLVSDKLPAGVMTLQDFLKGGDKPKADPEKPKAGNKAP